MVRGTTPIFKLTLDDTTVDLTEAANVYVSFNQPKYSIVKTGEDLDISEHEVDVRLSQVETLGFSTGTINVQVNWVYSDGSRACTDIVSIDVSSNLIGGVLS